MPSIREGPLHCGILGAGKFAATHAAVLTRLPYTTLTAVCDSDRKQCSDFTEKWGGRPCTDLQTLLSEPLDLLVVATPDSTHATVLQRILTASDLPHILIVEKPLCITAEELALLRTLVPKCQTRIIVDHSRRFNAGILRLRDLLRSGELGQLLSAHWTYYAGWFHTGVHAVDTLRMLLGECTCTAAKKYGTDRFAEDPLLSVQLTSQEFPEVPITLDGLPEKPYQLFEAEFHLSQGRIRLHWNDVFIDRLREGTYAPMLWFSEHFTVDPIEEALTRLYSSCNAARRGENAPLLDGADFAAACGTMEILFEAITKAKP